MEFYKTAGNVLKVRMSVEEFSALNIDIERVKGSDKSAMNAIVRLTRLAAEECGCKYDSDSVRIRIDSADDEVLISIIPDSIIEGECTLLRFGSLVDIESMLSRMPGEYMNMCAAVYELYGSYILVIDDSFLSATKAKGRSADSPLPLILEYCRELPRSMYPYIIEHSTRLI